MRREEKELVERKKEEGEKARRGKRVNGRSRWRRVFDTIRSVGFTSYEGQRVDGTRPTTASLLNNSKVREFVGLGVNS